MVATRPRSIARELGSSFENDRTLFINVEGDVIEGVVTDEERHEDGITYTVGDPNLANTSIEMAVSEDDEGDWTIDTTYSRGSQTVEGAELNCVGSASDEPDVTVQEAAEEHDTDDDEVDDYFEDLDEHIERLRDAREELSVMVEVHEDLRNGDATLREADEAMERLAVRRGGELGLDAL